MEQLSNISNINNLKDYQQALLRIVDIIKLEDLNESLKKEKTILHQLIEKYRSNNFIYD